MQGQMLRLGGAMMRRLARAPTVGRFPFGLAVAQRFGQVSNAHPGGS